MRAYVLYYPKTKKYFSDGSGGCLNGAYLYSKKKIAEIAAQFSEDEIVVSVEIKRSKKRSKKGA